MKKVLLFIFLVVVVVALGGIYAFRQWRFREIPEVVGNCLLRPQQMILYSINPDGSASALAKAPRFHDYRILGQVSIVAPTDRQRVVDAVESAVLESTVPAACFEPRHGLRVSAGHDTCDLLICFECGRMEMYAGGRQVGGTGVGGSPEDLNSILTAAGVPLARVPEP